LTAVYSNPFYNRPNAIAAPALDYSAPIHVPQADYRETTEDMVRSERAIRLFDEARASFRGGDFRRALDLTDRAIEFLPSDPALHQFRALVLFAAGNYPDASATIHSVLAIAPGWDRQTIEQLYDAPNRYATDVNKLAAYVNSRTGDTAGQFLLAYHLLALGETAAAGKVLVHVQSKHPNDQVTLNLLQSIRQGGR
jgi:predicted Zn-dependent protease